MEEIRLIKPYIEFTSIEQDFKKIFESGVFTRGQNVKEFNTALKKYVGAEHSFLTTSATTALWTCLKALDIGKGDSVAISDFSFPATANVVEDLGARPIFVDVNPYTYNMCPKDLSAKITKDTRAVIFVDSFGNPTGIDKIKAICDNQSIPLIEDAACALGSNVSGAMCGQISDLTCFSFHPRKLLCTGEGGAITTNNDIWAEWLETKLFHGAKRTQLGTFEFLEYGFNFRMSELQAAMGLRQLDTLDKIILKRNDSRNFYRHKLEPAGFVAQKIGKNVTHNVQSVVFRVPNHVDRDQLIHELKQHSIETTIGTYCQSNLPYYRKKYAHQNGVAAQLEAQTITFPCYTDVPLDFICEKILTLSACK